MSHFAFNITIFNKCFCYSYFNDEETDSEQPELSFILFLSERYSIHLDVGVCLLFALVCTIFNGNIIATTM